MMENMIESNKLRINRLIEGIRLRSLELFLGQVSYDQNKRGTERKRQTDRQTDGGGPTYFRVFKDKTGQRTKRSKTKVKSPLLLLFLPFSFSSFDKRQNKPRRKRKKI